MTRQQRMDRLEELDFYKSENERDLTEDFYGGEDWAIEMMYLRSQEDDEENW